MVNKEAKIGARESNRRWSKLWYRGKLELSEHKNKAWVLLAVHRGLCTAAYDSLRSEGIDCEPLHENPHISVIRPDEVKQIKEKFGEAWRGALLLGQPMRFHTVRMVSLVPIGWPEMERVWFLECDSPDLRKYRKDLGLEEHPTHEHAGTEMRFHVTFAGRARDDKKAEEILSRPTSAFDLLESLLKSAGPADTGDSLRKVFEKMEFSPEVNQDTMGEPLERGGPAALLKASGKALRLSRGEAEADDRDALAYQRLLGPEDLFADRIKRDAGQIGRALLWKSTMRGNLNHIGSGALTPQTYGVLLKSGLGSVIDGINPIETHDLSFKVSRMGEGGMSADAVPETSRSVQPSYFGILDPIRSPESQAIGLDIRAASHALKGADGQTYSQMHNIRTGVHEPVSARTASKSVIAFPGELASGKPQVRAMVRSKKVGYVRPEEVDYELPHPLRMFSPVSHLVAQLSAAKPGRLVMGARMVQQALPLKDPEVPLVQALAEDGRSVMEDLGVKAGAVRAKGAGVVQAVGPDGITVTYTDGDTHHDLYNHFPGNRKTGLHNTPLVKTGDVVKPGQVLAKSNYTDNDGNLALGTNLRSAYLNYRGTNFEDAISISESAAKKLTSGHLYQHVVEPDEGREFGRNSYLSMFPTRFNRDQLSGVSTEGVVRIGTVVNEGDPLVLSLNRTQHRSGPSSGKHKPMFQDVAETWDHPFEGVVTDVEKTKNGSWNVVVQAHAVMQEADKMTSWYGDKGVVGKIIPDAQMPHDKDGRPIEVLINPHGVISRANPAQIYEAWLGKAARARGKPYVVPSFNAGKMREFALEELKKNGLSPTEDLHDPVTGRTIPGVLTGERFFMKLHHSAESKQSEREMGDYTSENLPASYAKGVGQLQSLALISHGASGVLRDAHVARGQRQDDYWRALKLGVNPPEPTEPFIFSKALGQLQGAGIRVTRSPGGLHMFALTDKHIDDLAKGEIQSPDTVEGVGLKEIPGGLFDVGITGGNGGKSWARISLPDPMPNPAFETVIIKLLGLTKPKFESILAGREDLHGKSGPAAVRDALAKIDPAVDIPLLEEVVRSGRGQRRDKAIKNLGFLQALSKHEMSPAELMLTKVPVLPPNMRPITRFKGMQMTADANLLYRDLMHARDDYRDALAEVGPKNAGEERLRLYHAFRAVAGTGDPISAKTRDKKAKGLLAHVFGTGAPKHGVWQGRVMDASVDLAFRSVVTPNASLHIDQVAIPENQAQVVYRPFVMRRLVRSGMRATDAARAVAEHSPTARNALLEEMKVRPVLINRAPTLHKFGFMAAFPVLTKGKTIQVPPATAVGYGLDHDGDQQISTVIVAIEKTSYMLTSGSNFWKERHMAARFKTVVPGSLGHEFFCVNLQDFPHEEAKAVRGHIDFHAVPAGLKVVAYDEQTGKPVLAEVSHWSLHRERRVVTVELASGRQIISDDDPRAVYGLDPTTYELRRGRPSEAVGWYVPRVDRLDDLSAGGLESVPLPVSEESRHRLRTVMPLNRQSGWLMGALAGNGWATGNQVCLAVTDPGVEERYRASLQAVFLDPPHLGEVARTLNDGEASDRGFGNSRRLVLSSTEFREFVTNAIGTGARNKHLPPWWASAPADFRAGLLEGLMDTDGSVSSSKAKAKNKPQLMTSFTSSSIRLVQEVQHLLRLRGARSHITPTKTPRGDPFWSLAITAADLQKLDPALLLSHGGRRAVWESFDAVGPSSAAARHELIPFHKDLVPAVMECAGSKWYRASPVANSLYSTLSDIKTGRQAHLTRQASMVALDLFDGKVSHPKWGLFKAMVLNDSITWDRVTGFTDSDITETGFDLTVPGYETFMSLDGVILSNTMSLHVPATDDAVRDAVERMLPSKNLISARNFKAHYVPTREFQIGLHLAGHADSGNRPRGFTERKAALAAYHRGELNADDPVEVPDKD